MPGRNLNVQINKEGDGDEKQMSNTLVSRLGAAAFHHYRCKETEFVSISSKFSVAWSYSHHIQYDAAKFAGPAIHL